MNKRFPKNKKKNQVRNHSWRDDFHTTKKLYITSMNWNFGFYWWHFTDISKFRRPRNDFEHRLSNGKNIEKILGKSLKYRRYISLEPIKSQVERRVEQSGRTKKIVQKSPIFLDFFLKILKISRFKFLTIR